MVLVEVTLGLLLLWIELAVSLNGACVLIQLTTLATLINVPHSARLVSRLPRNAVQRRNKDMAVHRKIKLASNDSASRFQSREA